MTVGAWFTTEFDEPAPALEVPGVLRSGREGAFQAADHFVRGRRIVGRFSAGAGMLALKVRADGRPLRVRMELRLDAAALDWWQERVEGSVDANRGLPRLVLVRSQGALRRAVLLARNHDGIGSGDVRAVISFDLDPGEVPEDGFLIIELSEAGRLLPEWAADSFATASPVGLRVEWIEVTPVPGDEAVTAGRFDGSTSELLGVASAGGLVGGAASKDPGPPRTSFVVLNPASAEPTGGAELRCRLTTATRSRRAFAPPASGTWSRSVPGRAVNKARRYWRKAMRRTGRLDTFAARPVSAESVTVRAISLADGRPLDLRAQEIGGQIDLSLAPPAGPVLLGIAAQDFATGRRRLVCGLVEVEI